MRFEGEEVDGMRVTVRQYKGFVDKPLLVDEVVELRVQARVTQIVHETNERNGHLYRTHVLKIDEVEVP